MELLQGTPGYYKDQLETITVTVATAAALSGLSRRTIWNLIKTGKLPSVLIGRRRLIPYRKFSAFLLDGISDTADDTPVLSGQDAKTFVEKMNAGVMTPERLQYLQGAADASKKAEQKK